MSNGWWPAKPRTPFMSLLRVQALIGRRRAMDQLGGSGGKKRSYVLIGLMSLGLIPAIAMMFGFAWTMQAAYVALGQPHGVLLLMFIAAQVICLVFGIGYIVSAFYFDTESKLLVPLPLQPQTIAAARFWRVLSGEYATIGVVLVPFLIAYALQASPAWTFWAGIVPVFLLLPVVPLAISGAVAVLFMRLTAGRASRDVIRAVGVAFIMIVAISFSFVMQSMGASQFGDVPPDQLLEAVSSGRLQMFEQVGRWLPTTVWATRALQGGPGALVSFILYVVAAAAALAALLWLARRYLMAALLDPEPGRTKRRAAAVELSREMGRTRSPFAACFWREAVLLFRQPLFLMNALAGNLMMPVIMIVPMIINPELSKLMADIAPSDGVRTWAVLAAFGLLMMAAASSGLGSTAISREGRLFWISRALPASPRVQVLAKQLWAVVWGVFGAVILAVIGAVMFSFNATEIVLTLVGGVIIAWLVNGAGLMIDLARPNLTWTDPQQAMKGNWNALLTLVALLVLSLVVAGMTVALWFMGVPALVSVFVLLLASSGIVWWRLGPLAERQYTALAG